LEETITFELIRKIQREEQRIPKLTKLPDNFYNTLSAYLEQKRSITKDDRKTALEIKNIERLIEEIFNRRERKILNSAIIAARTKLPPENLTDEEKEFFDRAMSLIRERRDSSLKRMLSGEKEETVSMVVFKEDTPEFVAIDEKSYGPFKKGDTARLPEENMKVLIERGVAEESRMSK
jgi:DNA replication initiation complex subunit (GINS family)